MFSTVHAEPEEIEMTKLQAVKDALPLFSQDSDAFIEKLASDTTRVPFSEWLAAAEQVRVEAPDLTNDFLACVAQAYLVALEENPVPSTDVADLFDFQYKYHAEDWGHYGFEDRAIEGFGSLSTDKQEELVAKLISDRRVPLEGTLMLIGMGLLEQVKPDFSFDRAVAHFKTEPGSEDALLIEKARRLMAK